MITLLVAEQILYIYRNGIINTLKEPVDNHNMNSPSYRGRWQYRTGSTFTATNLHVLTSSNRTNDQIIIGEKMRDRKYEL